MNNYNYKKGLVAEKKEKYLTYRKYSNKYLWDFVKSWAVFVVKYEKVTFLKKTLVTLCIVLSIYWPFYYKTHPIIQIVKEKKIVIYEDQRSMDEFLNTLGFIESTNNYKAVNQFGYLGKYQLGEQALKQIGIRVPDDLFLENEKLQEVAIRLLLKNNKRVLSSYICKYGNKTIENVYITESGILGAAHLAPQGVIQFLKSNGKKVFKDRNGTPITKYLKELSGFKLELE